MTYTSRPFNEEAVANAVAGLRVYLSPADRHEAIRRLAHHRTLSIAFRLKCSERTVRRALATARAEVVA